MPQAEIVSVATLLENPIDQEKVPITWELSTGAVIDAEAIGVRVHALGRLAWTAGVSELAVRGYYDDDEEPQATTAHITGINADGTATGSATRAATRAKAFHASLEEEEEDFQMRRPACSLSIDRRELGSRIADDVRIKRMTREEAWAREVDRCVKRGLLDAAYKGLVKDPLQNRFVRVCGFGLSAMCDAMSVIDLQSLLLNVGIQQIGSFVTGLIGSNRTVKQNARAFKPNVFFPYGFQPDRFAYTALKMPTRRLIVPMPSKSAE